MSLFNDIKTSKEKTKIYIPQPLKFALEYFLKKEHPEVKLKTLTSWMINDGMWGFEAADRDKFYYENKNIFKNSEYRDYPVKDYVALESTIDKDYLISKLSLFCEPNKAKEVRDWENDIHSSLMLKESPDGSDSEILPLDGRLFEIIGDFKNVEDLKELMKRKGLDQDDIVMILKTVAKR